MDRIVVMVGYRAQPGCAETALRAIRALVDAVLRNEPACGGIRVLQDLDEPERITLLEQWPSREAFLGPHMQQPHIQTFIAGASGFLAGPPEITFWRDPPAV